MVKRLFKLLEREQRGLHEAALLLGFFTLLSQLLGFLRDRLLASHFGAGATLDVYYAAFRVPDFIFIWAASMVSLSVLIPFLSRRLGESRESAHEFLDTIFTAFFFSITLVAFVAGFFAPPLVRLLFPGFTALQVAETTVLMRIMLLQPILLGVSNLFASVTQLERRFFVYAVSPILYNLGIVAGVFLLYPLFGLAGLAYGVVLGAALHLAIQVPVIFRSGLLPRFRFHLNFREIREVALVSLPRTFALSAQNISVLVLTGLGSVLGAGSIAVFNLSWNLQSVPLAVVGASYSLSAFPTLSGLWNKGERGQFLEMVSTSLRHILFWSFPALALFVVLRAQIVRTVLGAGAFDWEDTRLTAAALALFAFSIVAQCLLLLFTRAYYAAGRTRAPVTIALCGASLTVGGAFFLAWLFREVPDARYFLESLLRVSDVGGTAVFALPLAYSFGTIASALASCILFARSFGNFNRPVWRTLFESFAAAVLIGFVSYGFLNLFSFVFNLHTTLGIFLQGFCAGVGGITAGILTLYLLGSTELQEIWRALHHKIWRAQFFGPDPTDAVF